MQMGLFQNYSLELTHQSHNSLKYQNLLLLLALGQLKAHNYQMQSGRIHVLP
jgi:hypothetical protein